MTVTSIRTHTEQIFQFHTMLYKYSLEEVTGDKRVRPSKQKEIFFDLTKAHNTHKA